jgi:CBS domain-containing protein
MHCPYCHSDNLQGADSCEQCGQPLSDLQGPTTPIESFVLQTVIGDLPLKSPISVSEQATLREAIEMMADNNIGCLLVTRDGQLSGIITERDMLRLPLLEDQADEPVANFMTAKPATCGSSDSLAFVVRMMSVGGYRHLPVMDQEQPIGLVSTRDVLKYLSTQFPDN